MARRLRSSLHLASRIAFCFLLVSSFLSIGWAAGTIGWIRGMTGTQYRRAGDRPTNDNDRANVYRTDGNKDTSS